MSEALGPRPDRGAAEWLNLAAAPILALMALLTATHGGGHSDTHGSGLGGMSPMYALMSVFHSAPWLKLLSQRRVRRKP